MKSLRLFLSILFFALPSTMSWAADFGLGVIAGDPTGPSVHMWVSKTNAAHVTLGWKSGTNGYSHITGDYLFYNFKTLELDQQNKLPFFYGIGVRAVDHKIFDTELGIRFPVGIHYFMKSPSLDFFAEIVPLIDFTPDTDFELDGGIGIHYRFN